MTAKTTFMPAEGQAATALGGDGLAHASAQLISRVGRQLYAIPIEHVVEIMRVLPIEPMARTPDYVRGLCIIRGAPVPVVDVGLLVGKRQTEAGRLIAIKTADRTIALQVDAVLGIKILKPEIFSELPPLLGEIASETVAAIGTLDSATLLALRAARIVPDDVFEEIERAGVES
jgi:purine-binding chemotaxis protein CheW